MFNQQQPTQISPGLQALITLQQNASPSAPGPGGQPVPTIASQIAQKVAPQAPQPAQPTGIAAALGQAHSAAPSVTQIQQAQQAAQTVAQAQQAQKPAGIEGLPADNMQQFDEGGIIHFGGKQGMPGFGSGGVERFDGEDDSYVDPESLNKIKAVIAAASANQPSLAQKLLPVSSKLGILMGVKPTEAVGGDDSLYQKPDYQAPIPVVPGVTPVASPAGAVQKPPVAAGKVAPVVKGAPNATNAANEAQQIKSGIETILPSNTKALQDYSTAADNAAKIRAAQAPVGEDTLKQAEENRTNYKALMDQTANDAGHDRLHSFLSGLGSGSMLGAGNAVYAFNQQQKAQAVANMSYLQANADVISAAKLAQAAQATGNADKILEAKKYLADAGVQAQKAYADLAGNIYHANATKYSADLHLAAAKLAQNDKDIQAVTAVQGMLEKSKEYASIETQLGAAPANDPVVPVLRARLLDIAKRTYTAVAPEVAARMEKQGLFNPPAQQGAAGTGDGFGQMRVK
jgi:hypothetical protein